MERLRQQEKEIRDDIFSIAQDAEDHARTRHGGVFATLCHKCLDLIASLRMAKEDLADNQREMDKLNKG